MAPGSYPVRGYDFYSRPCVRGDGTRWILRTTPATFLLAPLREGRRKNTGDSFMTGEAFLLAPLREGRHRIGRKRYQSPDFYSRPCVRGDIPHLTKTMPPSSFLLAPLREGRRILLSMSLIVGIFLLAPLREGRPAQAPAPKIAHLFLLAPLREGRLRTNLCAQSFDCISTRAPA